MGSVGQNPSHSSIIYTIPRPSQSITTTSCHTSIGFQLQYFISSNNHGEMKFSSPTASSAVVDVVMEIPCPES